MGIMQELHHMLSLLIYELQNSNEVKFFDDLFS